MKVLFMGTPDFAVPCLAKIATQHKIVGVYTQPDRPVGRGMELQASPVKKKALELGFSVFQPNKLSDPGVFDDLSKLSPDIIVVVAYGQILKKNVLELPKFGCINVHSSLLPRWRGAAPIHAALLAGDPETGVCTMKLVQKLDAGDILLESKTEIFNTDTAKTLHDRLALMGAELVLPTLAGLENGSLQGIVQDDSKVTYASKLTKEMELLKLNESALVCDRQVRALQPWPGTSIILPSGERLKIKAVKPRVDLQSKPGNLYERSGMLLLGCKSGSLELLKVQYDGKKEVDAAGFMNGLKGKLQTLPMLLPGF